MPDSLLKLPIVEKENVGILISWDLRKLLKNDLNHYYFTDKNRY